MTENGLVRASQPDYDVCLCPTSNTTKILSATTPPNRTDFVPAPLFDASPLLHSLSVSQVVSFLVARTVSYVCSECLVVYLQMYLFELLYRNVLRQFGNADRIRR